MIIPAIIGKDFNEVEEKILSVENLVNWIHLDIMDGLFTPALSWPYFGVKTKNLKVEVHLMVKSPGDIISKWIEAGVDRILVHYESVDRKSIVEILDEINDSEVEAGIVLKFETSTDVLDQYIDKLDVVQLMSIAEIGSYGQPFQVGVYDKIKNLRRLYPGVTISVDGGVNLGNASLLREAGVDNLIVGSAIFKSENIGETIKSFKNIR